VNPASWLAAVALLASASVSAQHEQHRQPAQQQDSAADAPTESEREHVPPDPPQSHLDHDMSHREMVAMMGMDDRARFGMVKLDRLEWVDGDDVDVFEWEAAAWYGGDIHKIWLESEGARASGDTDAMRNELSWDRVSSRWWSTRVGVRQDGGRGPTRTWAAFGVVGLAPGFFETDVIAYVGESGRSALRLATEVDVLITQRLVLQPQLEIAAFGKDDPERLIGSGLSAAELSLRLRYEITNQFAPHVGIGWEWRFGETADFARAAGEDTSEFALRAGVSAWF
jgi:copper resistance protein B